MLSKYQRRTAFRTAFRDVLEPAGFTRGKHVYSAEIGDHVFGVDFQFTFIQSYFVNVSVSFSKLIPLVHLEHGHPMPLSDWHGLDFLLRTRLEAMMPQPYPHEWHCRDRTRDEIIVEASTNLRNVLAKLDDVRCRFPSARTLLAQLPPEVLRQELRVIEERSELELSTAEKLKLGPLPIMAAIGGHWYFTFFRLVHALAYVAAGDGDRKAALEYLDVLQELDRDRRTTELALQMRNRLLDGST